MFPPFGFREGGRWHARDVCSKENILLFSFHFKKILSEKSLHPLRKHYDYRIITQSDVNTSLSLCHRSFSFFAGLFCIPVGIVAIHIHPQAVKISGSSLVVTTIGY